MEYLLLTAWRQNKVRLSDPVQKWPAVKPGCTHTQQQTRKKHMYTTTKTSQHRVETMVPRPPSSWWPWPAQMGCTQRGTQSASWSCPPHPWSGSAHLSSEPHRHHEASWKGRGEECFNILILTCEWLLAECGWTVGHNTVHGCNNMHTTPTHTYAFT